MCSGAVSYTHLSKYRQLYPGINISLQEQGCASLEPMVLSGDLDLAVTLLPVPPNFSWLQIRDEPLMVIMPPDLSLIHIFSRDRGFAGNILKKIFFRFL